MSLFTKTVPALLFLASSAFAGTIVGGSDLLSASDVAQLESWYGGSMTLTNIFMHNYGDEKTSADFHAAVDGQGPTISVIRVTPNNGTDSFLIGGYNPQSWSTTNDYNYTQPDALRTGFIFNLTTGSLMRQRLSTTAGADTGIGQYQTFNADWKGPTFGGGHDITVESNLTSGYVYQFSYGECASGAGCADLLGGNYTPFTVSDLEVFSLEGTGGAAQSGVGAVPEPGTWALLGTGFTALVAIRRRRK